MWAFYMDFNGAVTKWTLYLDTLLGIECEDEKKCVCCILHHTAPQIVQTGGKSESSVYCASSVLIREQLLAV